MIISDIFFASYVLQYEFDNYLIFYYRIVIKYNNAKNDSKDILYNFINIEDQISSRFFNDEKKNTYNTERLYKNQLSIKIFIHNDNFINY